MNRSFPGFGNEYITFNANNISQVYQFLPYYIIERLIIPLTDIIPADIELDFTMTVLDNREIGLAHIPHAHDTACQAN